jgi:hypothetical protein
MFIELHFSIFLDVLFEYGIVYNYYSLNCTWFSSLSSREEEESKRVNRAARLRKPGLSGLVLQKLGVCV